MAEAGKKKAPQASTAPKSGSRKYDNLTGGQWNLRYLGFVNAFLKQTGISETEAAQRCGIVRQTIYHWFGKDDAMLSSVEKLINSCGYSLRLSLEKRSQELGDAIVTINRREEHMEDD